MSKNILVGIKVKELRGQRTQEEMSKQTGVTQGQWSKLEGGIIPRIDALVKITRALGMSLDEFYDIKNTKPPPTANEEQSSYIKQPLSDDELRLIKIYRKLHPAEKEKVFEIAQLYNSVKESRVNVGGGSALKESNSK